MDVSKQYIENNVSPLPNITQSNKVILPISEVQNEEEYIKNALYKVYSGFKTLATDGPNAICKALVDKYAQYDVFIQSKLDELEKEIDDPQSTNDDKQRIHGKINRVSQSKQNIDKCYTDVLKFNIKQSNIVDTIMTMTQNYFRTVVDTVKQSKNQNEIENGNFDTKDSYGKVTLSDGSKKMIYNNSRIELTEAEAKYFLEITGGIGKETNYSGDFIKHIPDQKDMEAAKKAVSLFAKRNPKLALTTGEDVVLYHFGYKVIQEKSGKYYLVLSGKIRLEGGFLSSPKLSNFGNTDAKIKANIEGLKVLYHVQYNMDTSPVAPLTELNPTGNISKTEGHFYGGKGRVYCSRYPVIKNGTRATKQLLDMFNARVYEIHVSDIDKDKVFLDPEHSKKQTFLPSGKLDHDIFYIETDKPIPVTEVTSKWR